MKLNKIIKDPNYLLAFGFGAGFIKPAPGTWGSALGLILALEVLKMFNHSKTWLFVFAVFCFLIGIVICTKAGKLLNQVDDSRIVWDEITAMFFIVVFLPQHTWLSYLLAFLLFRFFDITKLFPIAQLESRFKNGFGVMLDDLIAGCYTILLLNLIYLFI